jgi:catechol 2,3-dioxygenase-like lactoylglutathione lyase family enzyme
MTGSSLLGTLKPVVQTLKYAHLGVAVRDIQRSINFFAKIGFFASLIRPPSNTVTIMQNSAGLELHLFQADNDLIEPEKNVLMDFDIKKYPGHTHACFSVSSVEGCREYLQSEGLTITG